VAVGSIEVATPRCLTKVAGLEGWRREEPLEYRISARPKWTDVALGRRLQLVAQSSLARTVSAGRSRRW
jgi:hypothetical protein